MIILHAGVLDRKLLLWAETNIKEPDTITVKKPRQKSNPRTRSAIPSPLEYDAGAERLLAALEEIGLDRKIHRKTLRPMTIWLPTVDNQPVPSSALIAEPPESVATATLTPWKVTVFPIPLEKTVEFLCRCVGRQTLGQGIIVGSDLSFWATAMRFAGALVAKQQFLPDVGEVDGVYFACWKPVFYGSRYREVFKACQGYAGSWTGIDLQSFFTFRHPSHFYTFRFYERDSRSARPVFNHSGVYTHHCSGA